LYCSLHKSLQLEHHPSCNFCTCLSPCLFVYIACTLSHRHLKMRTDGVHVRVRELGSIDFSFKLGKLMKNAIFQQKTTFHHLSEQISTFIHRKAKLTFGKKHGSYRSHHSCRKAESIVFARWRQYALFTYRNKYHYLTTLYLRCSCFI